MKKHFFAGRTEYFSQDAVPEKYRTELDAIIDNVKKIHGPLFVQHVKFMMNMDSLLGILITNMSVNDDCPEEDLKQIVVDVASQLAASHADALGLDEEEGRAAMQTVKTLNGIVKVMQDERNEDRKKGRAA